MHKVFISYHHENDQACKDELVKLGEDEKIFIDKSIDTGDISDDLDNQTIREKIRDEYLGDSTVTIVLVGTETKNRKHVDWEIYSSMYDGKINKKSGILVVNLPSVDLGYFHATHDGEKEEIYPGIKDWTSVGSRAEYERRYPYMPDRIIDNLLKPEAKVSVITWDRICIPKNLRFLVEATFEDRVDCQYDLSRPMKKKKFLKVEQLASHTRGLSATAHRFSYIRELCLSDVRHWHWVIEMATPNSQKCEGTESQFAGLGGALRGEPPRSEKASFCRRQILIAEQSEFLQFRNLR